MDQPLLTPDVSPIIRPEVHLSIPHLPLSEKQLSVVLDKTQEIILELLKNSVEIYLAKEEISQNKKGLQAVHKGSMVRGLREIN